MTTHQFRLRDVGGWLTSGKMAWTDMELEAARVGLFNTIEFLDGRGDVRLVVSGLRRDLEMVESLLRARTSQGICPTCEQPIIGFACKCGIRGFAQPCPGAEGVEGKGG